MLDSLIDKVNVNHDIKVILAGDLNFYFNSPLEADGGRLSLKLSSLALFEHLAKNWDLCDIWRMRNPDCKHFTYCQKPHFCKDDLIIFYFGRTTRAKTRTKSRCFTIPMKRSFPDLYEIC